MKFLKKNEQFETLIKRKYPSLFMQKQTTELNAVAQAYCDNFPEASATRNLLDGFNGGHFCEALRSGDFEEAIMRADSNNSMILYFLSHKNLMGFSASTHAWNVLESRAIQYIKESKMIY